MTHAVFKNRLMKMSLTIPTHSGCNAFLESAILTTISVDPQDGTLLILRARTILDLLLDGTPKKSLKKKNKKLKLKTRNIK
jgi:hypothetical protein